jgi:hypothetical protein
VTKSCLELPRRPSASQRSVRAGRSIWDGELHRREAKSESDGSANGEAAQHLAQRAHFKVYLPSQEADLR